jgi:hypothetical protein
MSLATFLRRTMLWRKWREVFDFNIISSDAMAIAKCHHLRHSRVVECGEYVQRLFPCVCFKGVGGAHFLPIGRRGDEVEVVEAGEIYHI